MVLLRAVLAAAVVAGLLPADSATASTQSAPTEPAHQLSVSTEGLDSNSGADRSSSVRTLARAQQLAREQLQQHGSVTVNVMPGVYRTNQTLVFSAADSGATWRGEGATLTGSVRVPWSEFETVTADPRLPPAAVGRVKKAKIDVDAGVGVPGMLFRDADRLQVFPHGSERALSLARWPNEGDETAGSRFLSYATMSAGYLVPQLNSSSAPTKVKPNAASFAGAPGAAGLDTARAQRWLAHGGAPQLAVHGAFRWQWADQMLRVAKLDTENSTLVFEPGCQALRYWPPVAGSPYYVTDLLQEISAGCAECRQNAIYCGIIFSLQKSSRSLPIQARDKHTNEQYVFSRSEFWLDRNSSELFVFMPEEERDANVSGVKSGPLFPIPHVCPEPVLANHRFANEKLKEKTWFLQETRTHS